MNVEKFKKKYPCNKFSLDWLDDKKFREDINIYFKDWFDRTQYYYGSLSIVLVDYFPQFFDIWWDPERFDKTASFISLCKTFPDKFDIWWTSSVDWDSHYFDIIDKYIVDEYVPENIDPWWDRSYLLLKYLPNKFSKWWPKKIQTRKKEVTKHFLNFFKIS